jgi:hypothetical protein
VMSFRSGMGGRRRLGGDGRWWEGMAWRFGRGFFLEKGGLDVGCSGSFNETWFS